MLVIHGGCGRVSKDKNLAIRRLFKEIGEVSLNNLKQHMPALEICSQAIMLMENSGILNAGCGGSLTYDGTLENEAAVMCGKNNLFGSVSCVTLHPNPVMVAYQLLVNQLSHEKNPLLLAPQYLCGDGVDNFAKQQNLDFSPIKPSPWAQKNYKCFKNFIQANTNSNKPNEQLINIPMDTVGAICVDYDGNLAVAASSGGKLLRKQGRIGHVALPSGSGIWVSNNTRACCVTGVGEQLAKLNFAKTLLHPQSFSSLSVSELVNEVDELYNTFNHLTQANAGSSSKKLAAGAVVVEKYKEKSRIKVSWIHSTQSMPVALISIKKQKFQYFDNVNDLYLKTKNSAINVVYV